MAQQVQFFFKDVNPLLRNRAGLKKHISKLFKIEGVKIKQITVVFCTDRFLLGLNNEFLNHDYYTDIVTFHYNKHSEPVIGELYISTDRVRENARELKKRVNEELHRVIFHGCLHLCGYQDKSSQQIKRMREREEYYLRSYFSKLKLK